MTMQKNGQYRTDILKIWEIFIGDASGQMTNTLVAKNIEKLSNYSFTSGITYKAMERRQFIPLSHEANEKV